MTLGPYQRECDDLGSYAVTPGLIKALMDNIETNVQQLDTEIKASKVADSFKKGWQEFADQWRAFYRDNERWIDRLWCSSYGEAMAYRGRLNEYRLLFIIAGGQAKDAVPPNSGGTGKPPPGPPAPRADGGGGGGFNLEFSPSGRALVVGGAVALAGFFFLIPLLKGGHKDDRRRADQQG